MTEMLLAAAETAIGLNRSMAFFDSGFVRIFLAVTLLGGALFVMLPGKATQRKRLGGGIGMLGIGILWSLVPLAGPMSFQTAFWLMASIAAVASVATIASRSPVHSAIGFAISLLGVAGLFLMQGAHFLGIATVAVYAGAIVVTFFFVLMLTQPDGSSFYDRIPWGDSPRFLVPFVAAAFVALLANSITTVNTDESTLRKTVTDQVRTILGTDAETVVNRVAVQKFDNNIAEIHVEIAGDQEDLEQLSTSADAIKRSIGEELPTLADSVIRFEAANSLRHSQHVARLGGNLFGRYLIAVLLAVSLLLIALVGAVAIARDGNPSPSSEGVSAN